MASDEQIIFTERRLFTLFVEAERAQKKKTTAADCYTKLNSILPTSLRIPTNSKTEINTCIRNYQRRRDQRLSQTDIINSAKETIVYNIDVPSSVPSGSSSSSSPSLNSSSSLSTSVPLDETPPAKKKSRGPEEFMTSFSTSYKEFNDLSDRQRRDKTQPLIDMLHNFVNHNKFSISVSELLRYLLMRENTSKTSTYQEGEDIYNQQIEFSALEAVSFMHTLVLSKEQTRKVRQFLSMKAIKFPTTNELLPVRKSLRPETFPVLDNKGRAVNFTELVSSTITSVFKVVAAENPNFDHQAGDMTMNFKDGGDGAGTMPFLKSKKAVDDDDHMFQYGLIPLKLTQQLHGKEEVVWRNTVPNAARSLRPIYLIREKENNPSLLDLVIKNTDQARNNLNENGIDVVVDKQSHHVLCNIKDSMKDLKFKKSISGLGGADCILCKSKVSDWTDLTKIKEGFKINRTAADTKEIFHSVIDEDGNIMIKPKDFDVRSGVTKEPLSDSDQHSITITHSYINGCTWFLKMLYRCHSDWPKWEQKAGLGQHLDRSKKEVRDKIKLETGLRLDYVCSAGGKGGTSTDGKQGRRFFSDELLPIIEDLLSKVNNKKYQENLLKLHHQLSIILRIVSCTRKIDVEKFAKHCEETMVNIATNFKWALLNHTLHGTIQHSAELIEMNGGESLGWYSEEGLEANNKDIRNYLERLSRKCDNNKQIEDVHHRLLERSDPYLSYITSTYIRGKSCSICEAKDHTCRSHDKYYLGDVNGIDDFFIE